MSDPTHDRLLALVDAARRAPSVLNTQPWRFLVGDGHVDLLADRDRQLRALDPDGRELTISCGAALATLRIAARHDGLDAVVEPFPDPSDPDHLARVAFGDAPAPPGDDRLYRAIGTRRTDRRAFAPDPLTLDVRAALAGAAADEGAWLRILTEAGDKEAVAELVEAGVRAQGESAEVQAEIRAWLRPDGDPRPDGVRDGDQGEWDRHAALRTPTEAVARHKAALVREAPAVLVLGTDRDDREAWLRAGLALGRALIVAADRGLAASYANEPVEAGGALRQRLAALVGGVPQVLFRLGRPADAGGTARRPLGDVVDR